MALLVDFQGNLPPTKRCHWASGTMPSTLTGGEAEKTEQSCVGCLFPLRGTKVNILVSIQLWNCQVLVELWHIRTSYMPLNRNRRGANVPSQRQGKIKAIQGKQSIEVRLTKRMPLITFVGSTRESFCCSLPGRDELGIPAEGMQEHLSSHPDLLPATHA